METLNESIEVARLFQEVMHLFKHNMKNDLIQVCLHHKVWLLGLLSKNKKMKITELSNQLCLSNSTVSGIIDRLEKQEMVVRERSKEDKRVVYVSISPNFKDMHKNFHKQIEKNIENIMSQGTQKNFIKYLKD